MVRYGFSLRGFDGVSVPRDCGTGDAGAIRGILYHAVVAVARRLGLVRELRVIAWDVAG